MKNPAKNNPVLASALAATTPGSRAGTLPPRSSRSLWLWVAGGFLLLAIMWAILFTVARSAKIESVPLTTQPGKP